MKFLLRKEISEFNFYLDFNFDEDCLVNKHNENTTNKDGESELTEEFNDLGN